VTRSLIARLWVQFPAIASLLPYRFSPFIFVVFNCTTNQPSIHLRNLRITPVIHSLITTARLREKVQVQIHIYNGDRVVVILSNALRVQYIAPLDSVGSIPSDRMKVNEFFLNYAIFIVSLAAGRLTLVPHDTH
jgi:hypothetical protein